MTEKMKYFLFCVISYFGMELLTIIIVNADIVLIEMLTIGGIVFLAYLWVIIPKEDTEEPPEEEPPELESRDEKRHESVELRPRYERIEPGQKRLSNQLF
jgi:hypothetical protein